MCVFDWKMIFIGYDYEVKLSAVVLDDVGMDHMILRNDLSWGFVWKEGEKLKQWGMEISENRAYFEIKLIMIDPLQNYDFWWVDRSLC